METQWQRKAVCLMVVVMLSLSLGALVNAQENSVGQLLSNHNIKEGYISVTGGKVWYRIIGPEKPGIPVIALHGGPGAPSDYISPMELLADDRPVVIYDQLGCGRSELPDDTSLWTVERFVEELAQVRQALNLEKVHLLGHSWGSMLAFEYYFTYPDSGVVSLISSGSFHSVPRWEADQQIYIEAMPPEVKTIIRRHEADGTTASAEYMAMTQVFYDRHLIRKYPVPNSAKRTSATLGVPYFYMWGPTEFNCTGTLKGFDHTPKFGSISVPTLFTGGEFDGARPETIEWYQSLVPGSEMKVFAGASHEHHLEVPEEYLAVVNDFIARAEGDALANAK